MSTKRGLSESAQMPYNTVLSMGHETLSFYAEKAIGKLPEADVILGRLPAFEWIDSFQDFRRPSVSMEKRSIIFARKRGPWLKPFHCYHQSPAYRYFSLDVAEGCLSDCVYCYLQSYLNQAALVVFVPDASLETELHALGENCWISTGLLSDSFLA